MTSLEIAVCGAGIGGLACAAALARNGHKVTILERFDTPQPLGAGLMLQPTGLAALEKLGCRKAAENFGRRINGIEGHTTTGRTIFDLSYRDLDPALYSVGIHRGALFQVLYDTARQTPIRWLTGVDIASSTVTGQRRALHDTKGKTIIDVDLVIDASGLQSRLRQAHAAIRYHRPYPYGAVWAAVPLPADWPKPDRLAQVYRSAKVMIGILPIGTLPNDATPKAAFFWSLPTSAIPAWQTGDINQWKAVVIEHWPSMSPFLDNFTHTKNLTPARYADTWLAQPFSDRLAFIGDAARAASPQLGQGANLALIDAVVLADALSTSSRIPDALIEYTKRRRAHTRFYGMASRALTPFFQSDSRAAAIVRDAAFAPLSHIPYLRHEMIRTLAGIKTGLFAHTTPARLLNRT